MDTSSNVKFSYLGTKIGLVAGAVTVIGGLVLGTIFGLTPNAPSKSAYDSVEYPAGLTSLVNGCGNFFTYKPEPGEQYAELTPEVLAKMDDPKDISLQPMVVPVYGYMSPEGLPGQDIRFYDMDELDEPLPMETILRSMYDYDTMVIWYTEEIAATDLEDIRTYVQKNENVMALKWDYKDKKLPLGRSVAFSKWGISQSCDVFTEGVVNNFTEFARDHYVERSEEDVPPAKFIKNSNKLYPILPTNYEDQR